MVAIRILHTCSWHSSFSWMLFTLAQGCQLDDCFAGSRWLQVYVFPRRGFSCHGHLTVLRLDVSPSHGGRTAVSPLAKVKAGATKAIHSTVVRHSHLTSSVEEGGLMNCFNRLQMPHKL